MRCALVRRPGSRLADGIVTHVERRPVDVALAKRQWDGYVRALAAAGIPAVEVAPADDSPDAVFVEDTLVVAGDLAVIARPGAPSRQAETAGAEAAVRALGFEVARIEAPATLDGGDVILAGGHLYVGTGGRTTPEGARQLAGILGARLTEIPIAGALHLKTVVTPLPDGSFAGWKPLVRDPAAFPGFRAVPEPSGANVVGLGAREVLVAADCPRSAELLASLGLEPVAVDIGELQKLEAGVSCLSVLLQDLR
jgi:dimethylargininase